MALIKCSECKKEVSTKAEKCPHCGAPVKRKTSGCALLVAIGFGVFVLMALVPTCSTSSSPSTGSSLSSSDVGAKAAIYDNAKRNFEASIEAKYQELIASKKSGDNGTLARLIRQFESFKRIDYKDVASYAKELRTFDALARLKDASVTDEKALAEIYGELSKLHPENEDYATQATIHSDAWEKELVVIREQQRIEDERKKMEAAEQAAKAAEEAKIASRKRVIGLQFSGWDGSHIALERIIKESMNDPDSYKHVETKYWDYTDYILVETTFRGKNAFGGVVKNHVRAKFTIGGALIEIVSQGP